MMRVYIGYDPAETEAAEVCAKSLRFVTQGQLEPEFLRLPKIAAQGLITRPFDYRGDQIYDLVSNDTASTQFKITRFLVPMLCQSGYALFLDCDMLFTADPREMLVDVRAENAVSVVKHPEYKPVESTKMMGLVQTTRKRKNWSSVMLFNCDHPANRRLSLRDVNERTAEELHTFYWLNDSEIGELAPRWNWLVNVQPKPQYPGIAHFTLGGPWFKGWPGADYDDLWLSARDA